MPIIRPKILLVPKAPATPHPSLKNPPKHRDSLKKSLQIQRLEGFVIRIGQISNPIGKDINSVLTIYWGILTSVDNVAVPFVE